MTNSSSTSESHLSNEDQFMVLHDDQIEDFYRTTQQFLTSKTKNIDYTAILFEYTKDIDQMQEKLTDEAQCMKPLKYRSNSKSCCYRIKELLWYC